MPAPAGSVWKCPQPGHPDRDEIVVLSLGYAPDYDDTKTVCLTLLNSSNVFVDPQPGELDNWPLGYTGPANVWKRIL